MSIAHAPKLSSDSLIEWLQDLSDFDLHTLYTDAIDQVTRSHHRGQPKGIVTVWQVVQRVVFQEVSRRRQSITNEPAL